MARRIVEGTRIDGPLGLGPPDAFKAALAAIQATTEKAAKLAETYAAAVAPVVCMGDDDSIHLTEFQEGEKRAAKVFAANIRSGDHLKEQSNAE